MPSHCLLQQSRNQVLPPPSLPEGWTTKREPRQVLNRSSSSLSHYQSSHVLSLGWPREKSWNSRLKSSCAAWKIHNLESLFYFCLYSLNNKQQQQQNLKPNQSPVCSISPKDSWFSLYFPCAKHRFTGPLRKCMCSLSHLVPVASYLTWATREESQAKHLITQGWCSFTNTYPGKPTVLRVKIELLATYNKDGASTSSGTWAG